MNALAYCAEIAGARRRIWRQGGKPPCQIARRQRAVEPCHDTALGEHAGRMPSGIGRAPQKNHISSRSNRSITHSCAFFLL